MQSKSKTVAEYLKELPADRQEVIEQLRAVIKKKLPKGFVEEMNYGMIGYVVPHTLYPKGYHCKPADPLPFMNIASQKNFIVVYHIGLYADPALMKWFTTEHPKCMSSKKVDSLVVSVSKSRNRFRSSYWEN